VPRCHEFPSPTAAGAPGGRPRRPLWGARRESSSGVSVVVLRTTNLFYEQLDSRGANKFNNYTHTALMNSTTTLTRVLLFQQLHSRVMTVDGSLDNYTHGSCNTYSGQAPGARGPESPGAAHPPAFRGAGQSRTRACGKSWPRSTDNPHTLLFWRIRVEAYALS